MRIIYTVFMLAMSGCAGPQRFVSNGELRAVYGRSVNSYECDKVDYANFSDEVVWCWQSGQRIMMVVASHDPKSKQAKVVRVFLPLSGDGVSIDDVENHHRLRNRADIVLTLGRGEFAKAREELDREDK